MRVVVVGGSGFVGGSCHRALREVATVTCVSAPRLNHKRVVSPAEIDGYVSAIDVGEFAHEALRGADVVINAAGVAAATRAPSSELTGANAILPLFIQRAAETAACRRYIHVSSAAVQGRMELDESDTFAPSSPYAASKAFGERVLLRSPTRLERVIYRPTSVQGVDRGVTQSLAKLARSPLGVVASPGTDPTPLVPIEQVGKAVRVLATTPEPLPEIALHPWGGVTTLTVVLALGRRRPRMIPRKLACDVVQLGTAVARRTSLSGHVRRMELLLLGQAQRPGWLDGRLGKVDSEWIDRYGVALAQRPSRWWT